MKCSKCGTVENGAYCSSCGEKLERVEVKRLPRMLTIEEATKNFFKDTVSMGFLYQCCRKQELPHVRMHKGKILLDEDKLITWWNEKLGRSTEKIKLAGLRKID